MGFKEILSADRKNIFLNPQEFGEVHAVDGVPMTIIIDENEIISRSKRQAEGGRIDGVYSRQLLFYVSRQDFGKLPGAGRELTLDGHKFRVIEALNEGGVYSITIGAYKS